MNIMMTPSPQQTEKKHFSIATCQFFISTKGNIQHNIPCLQNCVTFWLFLKIFQITKITGGRRIPNIRGLVWSVSWVRSRILRIAPLPSPTNQWVWCFTDPSSNIIMKIHFIMGETLHTFPPPLKWALSSLSFLHLAWFLQRTLQPFGLFLFYMLYLFHAFTSILNSTPLKERERESISTICIDFNFEQ
jgi:hypothetical protein